MSLQDSTNETPFRIAVETSPLVNGGPADHYFGVGLLEHLPAALPEAIFYYHEEGNRFPDQPRDNVRTVARFEDVEAELALSFFPGGYFHPLPEVLVVTDLNLLLYHRRSWWPFAPDPGKQLVQQLQNARTILVTHQKLRQLLIDQYGLAPAKITVVGYGALPAEVQITPADSVTRRITKETYGNEHSYFLAPAEGHESDNLTRLFAAYDLFRQRCQEPVRLLVERPAAGQHSRAVKRAAKQAKFRQDIVLLPTLSWAERHKVVSSARAIVHVSLSSAFPLPVLEAWTAEVPVLSTDNAIMQGAGTLVQGEDVKSIAGGLVALVTTPFLASGLVENGKRRRQDFTWQAVVEKVAGVLLEHR